MINQIEDMRKKIDKLEYTVKKKSDENETLKEENKSLKQQIEYLKSIFENSYKPESVESAMIKTGLFSEESIREYMRENKTTLQDMKKTVYENDVDRDTLIAKLQDQHQQDCIRINDLTTTVHVLARLYSTLRKNVGMD